LLIYHLTRTSRHFLLWALIATALAFTVVRIVLADLPYFKAELEQKIRENTHIPIHIGKLNARMRFFTPGIVLQDITIDKMGADVAEPSIQLKEIRIGIDLFHLLYTGDPVSSSKVTLVGAKLAVIRGLDGEISIKGLDRGGKPLWLLRGNQYEILRSQVSWQDLKYNGKQVQFQNFDMVLKNRGQNHEIHLLTTLPKEYGDSLRISALIKGNIFEANHIDGQIYIEGANLQAAALANGDLPLSYKIESGSGDVKLWSQWRDTIPYRIAGYVQAQQFKVSNSAGDRLDMDTLEGNISWLALQGSWRLAGYDIDIVANRQHWSEGEFYLKQDEQGNWSGLLKRLDIQALMHIAPLFLPEKHQLHDWLQLNPAGQLTDFAVFAQSDLQHYALQGNFSYLGNQALAAIPQLQGITGSISGSDSEGKIIFASSDVQLDAAAFFRNALTLKQIGGVINWQQQAENWQFNSHDFVIDSPDFQTATDFQLIIPKDKTSPYLDLRTRFGNISDVSRLPYYYPVKVMDKDALKWLDQAFIGGSIKHGEMVIRGALDQFPYDNGQGVFETIFSVENGELQFHPEWPHVQDIQADVQYLGKDLRVFIGSGHSENIDVKQLLLSIYALPTSNHAFINGQLKGSLQNALLYLQKTPLHPQVDPLIKLVKLESDTLVDLDLSIPYHEHMPFGINVAAHLNNAKLIFTPINLEFSEINGVLHFSENQISSEQLSGVSLGYPIQGTVNTDNSAIRVHVDGSTSADELQRQFAFLHNDMTSGVFRYQAELTIPHIPNQAQILNISSSLQGLAIKSEDFLAKTAEEQRPIRLDFQFDNKPLLPAQLHYGNDLNAALLIDTTLNRLHSAHMVAGQHEAETLQAAGLTVEIRQPEFKLSQAVGALSSDDGRWPPLRELLLETEHLIWQGKNLGAVRCDFQHSDHAWQGAIDSLMAKGRVSVPDQRAGNEPIKLDMDYLNVSAMSSLNFDAAEETIDTLPLIEIESRQLLWRTVNLGKLKLQTERRINGIHFKQITLKDANKNISFNADWIKLPHGSSTLISGGLNMDGFGPFLAELGFSDDFKETHADINFTGGWSDTPQQFSLAQLHGQLQVNLSDGRISSIEPGFGRLLGLISMEQWAKRLSLDFSDIYRQGLAFDKITGDFKISNGVAYTDDLLIDAIAAKMKVSGTANLIEKTLDHQVRVIPKSSDALPIAGTIVGGVAAFITDAVTDDYNEGYFFGSEYKVAGHWGDIEVTPLNERNGLVNKTWRGLTDFGWLKN